MALRKLFFAQNESVVLKFRRDLKREVSKTNFDANDDESAGETFVAY